jgi:hypothetical protein
MWKDMSSTAIATVVQMLESLPDPVQGQVVEHLREYLLDLQDEMEWDAQFNRTQQQLVAAARRAKQEGAEGKAEPYEDLHNIFSSHYPLPSSDWRGERRFKRFDDFYGYSAENLNTVLAPEGKRLYSPAAELFKRQAQRTDLPFVEIIQADLLILMMAFITPDTRWYPQTLHYSRYTDEFPFFIRASQRKNFKKLAIITGIESADVLRAAVKEGIERLGVSQWHDFFFDNRNFWQSMNMDNLDTLR